MVLAMFWPLGQAAAGLTGTMYTLSDWAPVQSGGNRDRVGGAVGRFVGAAAWTLSRCPPSCPAPSTSNPQQLTCNLVLVARDGGLELEDPFASAMAGGKAGCRGLGDAHGGGRVRVVHAGEAGAAGE